MSKFREGRKERFRCMIERLAKQLGKTVEEVIAEEKMLAKGVGLIQHMSPDVVRRELIESQYPGPECLEPYEFEDRNLRNRLGHVLECKACAGLVRALLPPRTPKLP